LADVTDPAGFFLLLAVRAGREGGRGDGRSPTGSSRSSATRKRSCSWTTWSKSCSLLRRWRGWARAVRAADRHHAARTTAAHRRPEQVVLTRPARRSSLAGPGLDRGALGAFGHRPVRRAAPGATKGSFGVGRLRMLEPSPPSAERFGPACAGPQLLPPDCDSVPRPARAARPGPRRAHFSGPPRQSERHQTLLRSRSIGATRLLTGGREQRLFRGARPSSPEGGHWPTSRPVCADPGETHARRVGVARRQGPRAGRRPG